MTAVNTSFAALKVYCFNSSPDIEACRFATTVAFYAAAYGSGDVADDKDYGCPGGFDGERIETMEDLFLLAVYQMYTRLLLPNEEYEFRPRIDNLNRMKLLIKDGS